MSSFQGIDEFERKLRAQRDAAEAEARRACRLAADELAARVKRSLGKGDPRNGHLIDTVEVFHKDADTFGVRVGSADKPYAGPLEFGHATSGAERAPPKKFFFPAVKIINKKHGRRIKAWFRKALKGGSS